MRQQEGQVCIASRFRTRTYSRGSDPLRPIVDGRVDMWALIHDNKGLESLSGSAQAGWVVGASVDIGGWGSAWWEHRIR